MSNSPISNTDYETASGEIRYNMTNDYMFRAVLQKNNLVLRGLISALIHLSEKEMISVEITNPIILGDAISSKEFRLDINVILNNYATINLEMQIIDLLNWHNRSLVYLCRSFDQLNRGEDYNSIKPVIHIGFLDFDLKDKTPEFYAAYKMLNVKNHQIYSDNFTLSVVDLNQIHLATEEDRFYHIDDWAALFKSKTWEEIKVLSEKNSAIREASKTIFELSADEQIRKRCLDREEFYIDLRAMKRTIQEQETELAETKAALETSQREITAQANEIAALKAQLAVYQNNS